MIRGGDIFGDVACWTAAAVYAFGFFVLAVKLKEVQVDGAAAFASEHAYQIERRVRTAGPRGRILARDGRALADNRAAVAIVCDPTFFQKRTAAKTATNILAHVARLASVLGIPQALDARDVAAHMRRARAMPLVAWRDVGEETLARFSERSGEFPGFAAWDYWERTYPFGELTAHVVGYAGRMREDEAGAPGGFRERELCGRTGLEAQYDSFLRGVPGERVVVVDAAGYARRIQAKVPAQAGPDLRLALDVGIQRAAAEALAGLRGACAVVDPRDGAVLALVNAPSFDPNRFVPTLPAQLYAALVGDPAKPLLNRASGGAYAPGSTFKPVTALAALGLGVPASVTYDCTGVYAMQGMRLRCAKRWGHGVLDMRGALRDSCNPYFCNLGMEAGTNALVQAARAFGLGRRTGLDLSPDVPGVVPDAAWKRRAYGQRWYPGDLAQMAIGQGMLLASPLQMALVVGAIGTGALATPHLRMDAAPRLAALPFPAADLAVVREGMRLVVTRGSGRRGAAGVDAWVIGKTGTAEIGQRERRRKNTWFVAYAESGARDEAGEILRDGDGQVIRARDPADCVAVAMVVEDGESGGGTTAPKVARVLKEVFNR